MDDIDRKIMEISGKNEAKVYEEMLRICYAMDELKKISPKNLPHCVEISNALTKIHLYALHFASLKDCIDGTKGIGIDPTHI